MKDEMTESQLRELDAWIAEHVFGYKWGHFGSVDDKTGLPELGWKEPIYLLEPERYGVEKSAHELPPQHRCKVDGWINKGLPSYPEYTTDPAAAMAVLEKCREKESVTIGTLNGKCCVTKSSWSRLFVESDTLPLAICLFAKQLFSK